MTISDLKALKQRFNNYVAGFYTNDPVVDRDIRLKEDHTWRVCENMAALTQSISMNGNDRILAEVTALFHDIGRFRQLQKYGTFNDRLSENHARLGVRELMLNRLLDGCVADDKRMIAKVIAYHNAMKLPADADAQTLLFMHLLRDADKLDIWQVFLDYHKERDNKPNSNIELGLPDEPQCSPLIIAALNEERFARMQDMKTFNDFKLLQLSWVFDLNFPASFQIVRNRSYIRQLEAILPQNDEIDAVVRRVNEYVSRNLASMGITAK